MNKYPRYFIPKPEVGEEGFYAIDFLFFRVDSPDTVTTVYKSFSIVWRSYTNTNMGEDNFLNSEHVYRCVEISEQEAALI